VLSVIDLYGDSSFGMAVIPQWIKKHIGVRPRSILSPDDYLHCSPGNGSFAGYVGICHLFATYLGNLGAKRKKNLMSIAKISKK